MRKEPQRKIDLGARIAQNMSQRRTDNVEFNNIDIRTETPQPEIQGEPAAYGPGREMVFDVDYTIPQEPQRVMSAPVEGADSQRSVLDAMSERDEEYEALVQKSLAERESEVREVVKKVQGRLADFFGPRIRTEKNSEQFRNELRRKIEEFLKDEAKHVSADERATVRDRIFNIIVGLGPLQQFFDGSTTEIMVSSYDKIFIEKNGEMVLTDARFGSEEELEEMIQALVDAKGGQINDAMPIADNMLDNGARFNAVRHNIAESGTHMTIRIFSTHNYTAQDYLDRGCASKEIIDFLRLAVESRFTMMVAGGTGSGKTTLLNMLSQFLSYKPYQSVITIEDTPELRFKHANLRREITRAGDEKTGTGAVTTRDLAKAALRQRPDRIVFGEIRDGTMADFLMMGNSGHEGLFTTIHVNSPDELSDRVLMLFLQAPEYNRLSNEIIKTMFANCVDLVVQVERCDDNVRRITHVSHIVGYGARGAKKLGIKPKDADYMTNDVYVKDIFRWRRTGEHTGPDGRKVFDGVYEACHYIPAELVSKAYNRGVTIDKKMFYNPDYKEDEERYTFD